MGAIEGTLEAGTTTPHMVFGGVRLLGGLLLVFGLLAIYAYQVEDAGRLGIVGFVVSMIGTVLLTGQAWFIAFFEPALVSEAPGFIENVMGGQAGGPLVAAGLMVPIFTQAIGWTIFGIATYRAEVFPRLAAIVLTVGPYSCSSRSKVFPLSSKWELRGLVSSWSPAELNLRPS